MGRGDRFGEKGGCEHDKAEDTREAILVGSAGLNVAQSDITTDYYQADEAAWKALISNPSSDYHIDGIRYDESSRKFQVKVSWTITDTLGRRKGILILGIDVEEALRNSH